ncbi:MAG: secretion protein HylD [Sphingomonas bacterium]|uniref:efflux RND transporter periplasmic adaptor subunit n=1 Tax=Sphingomonas bacterium TaxID=1895847 RepID=UPI00260505DB|nr:efflux RND transporter periplasmic adaptor subunit [Sphingomonas bacterium]MDB5707768.1 secretion protein HylD [Sphingomonas bacterium]
MNYGQPTFGNDDHLALPGGLEDRPNRRWWIIGAVILAVLVVAMVVFAFSGGKKDGAAAAEAGKTEQLPTVSVAIPGRLAAARIISATGTLAARREMPVGVAGEGGMVARVLVEPGQWVAAGQVLATVDRSVQIQTGASLAAQVNVARSDAAIAQSELDRAQQLVNRGFISKADLERKAATRDAAVARVRVAQAQLGEQNARTGRLDIRAPAAGLVLTRSVEPGMVISSGSGTLFRMAKGGEMEMRAQLSEADLVGLPVGVSAQVVPVGGDTAFSGQVWQVSPVIDPQTRQGIARIALSYNPALKPGGFASATIKRGSSDMPQLPNSAIQSDTQGNFVYIVGSDDKVVRRPVKLGEVSDTGVSIIEGLNGTERVVLSAGAFLNPGQKIKPILQKTQG